MDDLRTLHDELLAGITELDALTAGPAPDGAVLSKLRYRLSRVSGARRRLVDALCDELIASGAPADALSAVRSGNAETRVASTAHIGTWSLADVGKDWQGYCRASATMRAKMRRQIEREKAVLYPYLAGEQVLARAL